MIAIVDDYEAVRKGLESLLRSMGHNASTFDSAEDFLRVRTHKDSFVHEYVIQGLRQEAIHESQMFLADRRSVF